MNIEGIVMKVFCYVIIMNTLQLKVLSIKYIHIIINVSLEITNQLFMLFDWLFS